MIEMNDDLLNKFIDGELDSELMSRIKRKLDESPEDMKKYKMLLSVHNELKKMPVDEVSPVFTSTLMLKIQRNLKSKREQNFFIISVLSLFLLISLGIIGYLLSDILFAARSDSSDILTRFANHSEDLITFLKNFFSKGNMSIIGSVFSFILLISGYFFYESIKNSGNHKSV